MKIGTLPKLIAFVLRYVTFLLILVFLLYNNSFFIESPLLIISQKIMSTVLGTPIEPLQINQNGQLFMPVPPLEYIPQRRASLWAFCILLPLVLATPSGTMKKKSKMLLTSIIYLSLLEVLFIIIEGYGWLFSVYPQALQKGMDLFHIINYQEHFVFYYLFISGFLKHIHFVLILSIWLGVVYWYRIRKTNYSIIDVLF